MGASRGAVAPPFAALLLAGLIGAACGAGAGGTASPTPLPPAHAALSAAWRVFGPLPLGGVGADPLAALPGSLFSSLSRVAHFPSETARGGFARWTPARRNATTGVVSAFFNGSAPPLTAWAVGNLRVRIAPPPAPGAPPPNATFVALRCSHAAYVLPPSAAPAPVRHCTHIGAPCALRLAPGAYAVYVHFWAWGPGARFACEVDRAVPRAALLALPGAVRPAAVAGPDGRARLAGAHAAVVLHNADPEHWAAAGVVRVRSDPAGIALARGAQHPPRLAPQQTRALRLDLDDSALGPVRPGRRVRVDVDVEYAVAGELRAATFTFDVAVLAWPPKVYDATYLDADGSVQAVSLRPPQAPCPAGCAALLSTHGAGVDALGNAWTGAYATQRGAWVLLPTGRRKFGDNWEGAQLQSALRCLRAVAERTPGVPEAGRAGYAIRKDWAMFSGHSMGGHGALVLSTHFPDLMVAALPISGWLRYATYGRDGDAFRPQLPFSDAGLRAIFDLSVAEYATDLYSENVVGIPFTARVGSIDQNVPPTNLRKFCRLIREYELYNNMSSSFVTLNEVPGKGHWFGGVMDDGVLQPYLDKSLSATSKPELPSSFSLFTINPATTGSRGGFRVMQLQTPFESARISVKIPAENRETWTVVTRNVHRFRYRGVNGVNPRPQELYIDDNARTVPIPQSIYANNDTTATYVDFCASVPATSAEGMRIWDVCPGGKFPRADSLERGPDTSGPLAQVISGRRVVVIYPAGDTNLLGVAVRYANALYGRGIGASITPDSAGGELLRTGLANLVVLGGASVNSVARRLQDSGHSAAVRTSAGKICIGKRCTERPGAGIAFLAPGHRRSLVAVIAGVDSNGFHAAASFLPESAEQKIPEWVLVQAQDGFGWRGYGGIEAAGYWSRNWLVDPARTYPAEWAAVAPQVAPSKGTGRFLLVVALIAVALVIARAMYQLCSKSSGAEENTMVGRGGKPSADRQSEQQRPFLPRNESSELGVQ